MSNAYPIKKDIDLSSFLIYFDNIISSLKNIIEKLEEIEDVQ